MVAVLIHIYSSYAPFLEEIYYYPCINIADKNTIEDAVSECIDVFLDAHLEDIKGYTLIDEEKIMNSCSYVLEVVHK